MSWLAALLVVNIASWGTFAMLARHRCSSRAALASGVLHMLFITPISIAPLRALIEPGTFNLGLAWLQVGGWPAAIPALILWVWGLTAALVAINVPKGRALRLLAIGDLFVAANFGTYFTVQILRDALRVFTAQAGGFVSLSGAGVALVLMVFFVVPFTLSAFWAFKQVRPVTKARPPNLVGAHHDDGRSTSSERRDTLRMSVA